MSRIDFFTIRGYNFYRSYLKVYSRKAGFKVGNIEIEVWDVTGNKKTIVDVPDDEPVNRIMVVLTEKMSLPAYAPDGRLMSYKFHHKRLSRQIPDKETFFQAEVKSGDILRIQPEITAGKE